MFTKADLFLSYDIPDISQSRSQYNEPDIHSGEKLWRIVRAKSPLSFVTYCLLKKSSLSFLTQPSNTIFRTVLMFGVAKFDLRKWCTIYLDYNRWIIEENASSLSGVRKPSLSESGCGSPLNQCQEENYFPAPALISLSLSLNIYRTIMQQNPIRRKCSLSENWTVN